MPLLVSGCEGAGDVGLATDLIDEGVIGGAEVATKFTTRARGRDPGSAAEPDSGVTSARSPDSTCPERRRATRSAINLA